MPSHIDDPSVSKKKKKTPPPAWLQPCHIKANAKADEMAKFGAREHEVPVDVAKVVLDRFRHLKLIQGRLVAVVAGLPQRPHRPKVLREIRPSRNSLIDKAVASTKHVLTFSDQHDRYNCISCNASVSKSATHLISFLEATCVPAREPCRIIPIGKKFSHPSHQLKLYGGVLFCISCGAMSRSVLVKLARPCLGKPAKSSHGDQNLVRY